MSKCSICKKNRPLKPRKDVKTGFYTWCVECHRLKRKEYLSTEHNRAYGRAYVVTNKKKVRGYNRASFRKLRKEMLVAYGEYCHCCGETEEEFLTLEHLNRDGGKHRKEVGGGWAVIRELRDNGWPTDGYTILCMNCNWATRFGSTCPHKR
jgi:hypothetical protein